MHKCHLIQSRKCRVNDSNVSPPQICKEPIDIIFENFDLDAPQASPGVRRSNRKRKFMDPLSVDPKRKKYLTVFFFFRKKPLVRVGVLWDRYLPIDGLFQILYYARVLSKILDTQPIFDWQISRVYATPFLCILLLQYICKLTPYSELSFRGPNLGPHK